MSLPPSDEGTGLSEAELLARREALGARLDAHRRRADPAGGGDSGGRSLRGAADGMKLASEFVAGVLAGAGIGYLIDRIAGTGPFGLILFLLFGFVAGVLNVLRSVAKTGPRALQPPNSEETPDRRPE